MSPLMRPILRLSGLAALGLAAALAVLPARWLTAALPADGLLSMADATGSIWAGQARIALGPPHHRRTVPDALQWRIEWSGLLPQARITHPWLAGPVVLRLRPGQVDVSAQSLELPASSLILVHEGIRQIDPQGIVRLQWPATSLGAPAAPGTTRLTLDWQHAASALSPIRPLGDYRATLRQAPDGLDLNLESRKGPLLLSGTGRLLDGRLSLTGQAAIAPQADEHTHAALMPLLKILGPLSEGQARLDFH